MALYVDERFSTSPKTSWIDGLLQPPRPATQKKLSTVDFVRFLSRVSIMTRDIDIEILSDRPSVRRQRSEI